MATPFPNGNAAIYLATPKGSAEDQEVSAFIVGSEDLPARHRIGLLFLGLPKTLRCSNRTLRFGNPSTATDLLLAAIALLHAWSRCSGMSCSLMFVHRRCACSFARARSLHHFPRSVQSQPEVDLVPYIPVKPRPTSLQMRAPSIAESRDSLFALRAIRLDSDLNS